MNIYKNRIYPFIVNNFGNPLPIKKIRKQIIPFAEGNVLEIGVGSGANFPFYDSDKVTKLYALEPNLRMIQIAKTKLHQLKLDVEFIGLPGDKVPLANETIDTIVSTFTLYTVEKIDDVFREIKRIVKPGGKIIFYEIGLSPDSSVGRWQKLFERFAKSAFAGLVLTRDIPKIIISEGFQIQQIEAGYISSFSKSLTYCFWGVAIHSYFKAKVK